MNLINQFLSTTPNLLIAFTFALLAAALSIVMAKLGRRIMPLKLDTESHEIATNIQKSLIAFAVLLLAFAIGEARQNLANANEAVNVEALKIKQFDHHLALQNSDEIQAARRALANYTFSLIHKEWPALASQNISDLQVTRDQLEVLANELDKIATFSKDKSEQFQLLKHDFDALEKAHDTIIEKAQHAIPSLFWSMMLSLVMVSMLFNARYQATLTNHVLIGSHMAVIGASIAFLAMLDAPFRGETSVRPQAIEQVCVKLIVPCK